VLESADVGGSTQAARCLTHGDVSENASCSLASTPHPHERFRVCGDEGEGAGEGASRLTTGDSVPLTGGSVSNRERSDAALRESEERFRIISGITSDAIWD
jgi:hypothetical protein